MKKLFSITLLLLSSCSGTNATSVSASSLEKYYRIFYNGDVVTYFDNQFIYFDNGKLYDNRGELFSCKIDTNGFIYNEKKIWGKLYSEGLILRYNTTYGIDFSVINIYGNNSYLTTHDITI